MITEKNHKLLTSQTDCTKKGLASMLQHYGGREYSLVGTESG